jgi:molybdopterin-guanine dinucleotide biosynthesis protein A
MGRTKSLVEVGGVPMGRIVADVLAAGGCHPVAFVGGDARELAALGCEVVADRYPDEGPLGGVLTALHHFDAASHVLIAACDLPLLDVDTVRLMLDAAADAPGAAAVVADSGRREPGLVVWSRAAFPDVVDAFAGGTRAVHALLDRLDAVGQPVDPAVMRNVNRPSDVPGSANEGADGQ